MRSGAPERIDQAAFGRGRLPAKATGFGMFTQISKMLRFSSLAAGQRDHRPRFSIACDGLKPGHATICNLTSQHQPLIGIKHRDQLRGKAECRIIATGDVAASKAR